MTILTATSKEHAGDAFDSENLKQSSHGDDY